MITLNGTIYFFFFSAAADIDRFTALFWNTPKRVKPPLHTGEEGRKPPENWSPGQPQARRQRVLPASLNAHSHMVANLSRCPCFTLVTVIRQKTKVSGREAKYTDISVCFITYR